MKKIIKRFFIISGLLSGGIILFLLVTALIQVDFSNEPDIDVFITKKLASSNIAGFTALTFKDGQVTWSKNYGYADKKNKKKITDSTIFQIASVSKTVTGTAVMQLVERGVIDLEGSINSYLPVFIKNPHHPDKKITVKMLLQHKSSLIDNEKVLDSTYTIASGKPDPVMSLEDFVNNYYLEGGSFYSKEKNFSTSEPGSDYEYSNAAFGLLGYMVEHVTGNAFNEYCKTNIFEPLGMDSTGWYTTEVDMSRMTHHYDMGKALKPYSFTTYPDGALKTTSRDFAIFVMAILGGGSYEGKRILKETSVELMMPADYNENLVWEPDVLDTFALKTNGKLIQGHTGGDPGVFTLVCFNRENKRGVIFFMNSTPAFNFKILNVITVIKRITLVSEMY